MDTVQTISDNNFKEILQKAYDEKYITHLEQIIIYSKNKVGLKINYVKMCFEFLDEADENHDDDTYCFIFERCFNILDMNYIKEQIYNSLLRDHTRFKKMFTACYPILENEFIKHQAKCAIFTSNDLFDHIIKTINRNQIIKDMATFITESCALKISMEDFYALITVGIKILNKAHLASIVLHALNDINKFIHLTNCVNAVKIIDKMRFSNKNNILHLACNKTVDYVEQVLKTSNCPFTLLGEVNDTGKTPFQMCVYNGNFSNAKYLVNSGFVNYKSILGKDNTFVDSWIHQFNYEYIEKSGLVQLILMDGNILNNVTEDGKTILHELITVSKCPELLTDIVNSNLLTLNTCLSQNSKYPAFVESICMRDYGNWEYIMGLIFQPNFLKLAHEIIYRSLSFNNIKECNVLANASIAVYFINNNAVDERILLLYNNFFGRKVKDVIRDSCTLLQDNKMCSDADKYKFLLIKLFVNKNQEFLTIINHELSVDSTFDSNFFDSLLKHAIVNDSLELFEQIITLESYKKRFPITDNFVMRYILMAISYSMGITCYLFDYYYEHIKNYPLVMRAIVNVSFQENINVFRHLVKYNDIKTIVLEMEYGYKEKNMVHLACEKGVDHIECLYNAGLITKELANAKNTNNKTPLELCVDNNDLPSAKKLLETQMVDSKILVDENGTINKSLLFQKPHIGLCIIEELMTEEYEKATDASGKSFIHLMCEIDHQDENLLRIFDNVFSIDFISSLTFDENENDDDYIKNVRKIKSLLEHKKQGLNVNFYVGEIEEVDQEDDI